MARKGGGVGEVGGRIIRDIALTASASLRRMRAQKACPNCRRTGDRGIIYSCKNGHPFCDRCIANTWTALLKLRVDECPQCGERAFKAIGLISPTAGRHTRSVPR